jgi:hypothetical protein
MKDLEWMIGSWKKLKGIHGGLNRDLDVNAQLKDLLGNHGISHGEYRKERMCLNKLFLLIGSCYVCGSGHL